MMKKNQTFVGGLLATIFLGLLGCGGSQSSCDYEQLVFVFPQSSLGTSEVQLYTKVDGLRTGNVYLNSGIDAKNPTAALLYSWSDTSPYKNLCLIAAAVVGAQTIFPLSVVVYPDTPGTTVSTTLTFNQLGDERCFPLSGEFSKTHRVCYK